MLSSFKIVASVFTALVVLLVFMVAASVALDTFGEISGLGWLGDLGWFWLLLVAIILVPARYRALPIPFTRRGSVEIDAPPEAVWPRVQPRPGNPFHATLFSSIEAVAGTTDEVLLHVDRRFVGGSPQVPAYLHARIVEEVPARKIALRYRNAEQFPLFSSDLKLSEVFIEPIGASRSRVTFVEHVKRFRPSALLMFVHLNPAVDAGKRLKAQCEGTEDESWIGRMVRDSGPNGEPPAEVARKVRLAGISAVVFCALLVGVVFWLIANMA